jgi:hypothetical protein
MPDDATHFGRANLAPASPTAQRRNAESKQLSSLSFGKVLVSSRPLEHGYETLLRFVMKHSDSVLAARAPSFT